ncbi:MAG: MFS transporter [Desulfofustis sp.]|nr:MFS transporter [Desulfofustis sp.]
MTDRKAGIRRKPGNRLMIILLIVAVFFSMIGRTIFSPVMPYLQEELAISLATVGTLFLLSSISYSLVMVYSGYLTAWIGHGNTVVAALVMITVGMVISAGAGNALMLAAGMICIGAGGGTYAPSGIAMVNSRISIEKRSTAFSFHEVGSNSAVLLAPIIVLAAVPLLGWRGVLLLLASLAAVTSVIFYVFGAADSGVGAKPNLNTIGTILRLPNTYVAMLVFSTSLTGLHGVYSILPAYLVEHSTWSPEHVNSLVTLSRVISISILLLAGPIIKMMGRRNTIMVILLFTGVLTGLISVAQGRMLELVVVLQPALIAAMFPAQLSCLADIGETRYLNVTSALVITVGMIFGAGVVPALVGVLGDLGVGWLGFVALALIMFLAVAVLMLNPSFGKR